MSVSAVFMLLLIYTVGVVWSIFLPRQSWVEGTRLKALGPVLHFVNPGPFQLKEVCISHSRECFSDHVVMKHVIASIVASTASYGSTAVLNFAVQRVGSSPLTEGAFFDNAPIHSFITIRK